MAYEAIPSLDIDGQARSTGMWEVGADEYYATATAVRLASYRAVGLDAAVSVEWETASELDNLGFHLYRGLSENGPWQRLTKKPVAWWETEYIAKGLGVKIWNAPSVIVTWIAKRC